MKNSLSDLSSLDVMKDHPVSGQIDEVFKSVIKEEKNMEKKTSAASANDPGELTLGDDELDFSLDLGSDEELGSLDLGSESVQEAPQDEGLELSLDGDDSLELGDLGDDSSQDSEDFGSLSLEEDDGGELSLGDETDLSLEEEDSGITLGEIPAESPDELNLGETSSSDPHEISLGGVSLGSFKKDLSIELGQLAASKEGPVPETALERGETDLSADALKKLKEIDAIMEYDASQVISKPDLSALKDKNLDEPLVSPDLDLASLNFSAEDEEEENPPVKEDKKKKKKEEVTFSRELSQELKEITGAYSGEMERMQATISNLRADRDELLAKIQKLEEDKVIQSRQSLSVRAELDERKIELTIIRKKLNEEINELKDRLKLFDEKRLILEEKNRILMQELDKAAQKNKIDMKKVQMRERELEQKLELLKADAETQIRNRDLKILELKRKIDSMEFDMESISMQEKRSVESRYELEDKLEKAIKTLRTAITVLEDESDRSNALTALKKNIDV